MFKDLMDIYSKKVPLPPFFKDSINVTDFMTGFPDSS